MLNSSLRSPRRLAWILGMTALMAVGAYIQLPLGPVPLSLQTFFVLLAGFVLGPAHGALAAALYLAAGVVGLPVFAGGSSGIASLAAPTGGFLLSFVPMAAIAGVATRNVSQSWSWSRGFAWGAVASVGAFVLGVPWLALVLDLDWRDALDIGCLPFLPGAVIKLVLSVATNRLLEMRRLLPR